MQRFQLRFRRQLRRSQRQVEGLGAEAEKQIEQLVFKRFHHLGSVRRFVLAWAGLLILLSGGVAAQNIALTNYFQTLRPVPGGIYTEGIHGTFTNANPLYASTSVDQTVSRLLFAGLFKYDDQNHLVGDLASDYSVDEHGATYTVRLKPHLTWQDGQPLTSADILYTYQMIQNPDAQSPLQSSWQGITITAPDAHTVVFALPGPLASFPYMLTNGIVPKHVLSSISPENMRTADFNTIHPVGAGPFQWQAIQVADSSPANAEEQIALTPFANYADGQPKLQEFVVRAFGSEEAFIKALKTRQLTGAAGLSEVPKDIQNDSKFETHSLSLTAANMVFFKTTESVLSDAKVRQALVQGADVQGIIQSLGYPAHRVNEPFLTGQLGYDPAQKQVDYDAPAARKLLDDSGWKVGKGGIRYKDNQPLRFTLSSSDAPEYQSVARQLRQQWARLGADVQLQFQNPNDFQGALAYHSYDAVLYAISIGGDPDVFVYWDSSQADIRSPNRLNFSEYKNATADTSIEAGRTRLNAPLRVIKYRPFLQAWRQDNPALGLYQPRYLYITSGTVYGLNDHPINSSVGRFNNVENWQVRQARVTN